MRSCWLGNPIAISGESNVYISNGWGGASMYDAGSRLRWYMQPAAAGHSIALMREAIRRHEHAIKTTWYMQPAAAGHSIALMREAIRRHEHAIKTTWFVQPAAAGHSIALMREAIRRHEHAIKTTQPFERVRPSSTPDCADGIRG